EDGLGGVEQRFDPVEGSLLSGLGAQPGHLGGHRGSSVVAGCGRPSGGQPVKVGFRCTATAGRAVPTAVPAGSGPGAVASAGPAGPSAGGASSSGGVEFASRVGRVSSRSATSIVNVPLEGRRYGVSWPSSSSFAMW